VDVPVYVIGRDQKPVLGLTKNAFEIFEDGKQVPLDYFTVIDLGARANHPLSSERRQRRLYVLLFDYEFKLTRLPAKLVRAQKAAQTLIEASDPTTDLFAIATYTSNRGVFFLTPFRSDKAGLKAAVSELRENKGRADSLGLLAFRTAATASDVLADPTDEAGREMSDAVSGGAMKDLVHEEEARAVEGQFSGLGELADRLAGIKGQKHVVFFTEGFNSAVSSDGFGGHDGHFLADLESMHRRFQAAGVFLDSVDVTGIGAIHANRDALAMVSRDAGGQVIENTNDLAGALTELSRSQQVVYLLGLRRHDDRTHRIAVRVNGVPRGSQVFYREGYGPASKRRELDPLVLADIITNDEPQNGFTANVAISLVEGATQVTVSFKRDEVAPQIAGNTGRVIEHLYIFNTDRAAVASAENYLDVDRPESQHRFQLPAGHYTAKVLLRIDGTDSLAFVRRDFVIP